MLTLICTLAFTTVCLFIIGITMAGERALLRDRVEALRLQLDIDKQMIAPELAKSFGDRIVRPALRRMAEMFTKALPGNLMTTTEAKLERAGWPWRLRAVEFVGLKVVTIIVFLVCGITVAAIGDLEPMYRILVVVMALIIGYALPDSLLEQAIRERQRVIRKSLADSLDLLVVSAEAGLGFDGAVAKVVDKTRGPLADEFGRTIQDMSIGRTRMEALRSMANRIGLPEITTFVAAIHQADMLGVSIGRVLRVQAESLRNQRNIRARESAAKLPVKMLFPLVFFIFPAIFVVVLGPAMIQISRAFK